MHDQVNQKSSLVSDRHFGHWLLTATHQGFSTKRLNFHFDVSLSHLSEHQHSFLIRPEEEIEKHYLILILYFKLW